MPYLIALLIGLASSWFVQDWRYEGKINEMKLTAANEKLAAEQTAYNIATQRMKEVQDALRQATQRATAARAAAADATASADRLRDAISRSLQAHSTSLAACNDGAALLGDVLNDCKEKYRGLGEKADRLDNDRRTLMEAWPK